MRGNGTGYAQEKLSSNGREIKNGVLQILGDKQREREREREGVAV